MSRRSSLSVCTWLILVLGACGKEPTALHESVALTACPAGTAGGRQDVNAPIPITFNVAVLPQTVITGNVLVSDAATGVELPGSVTMVTATDSTRYQFTPSQPFPFDTLIRIRVQNVLSARTLTQIPITVCSVRTSLAPITQLYWEALPNAGSSNLIGAAFPSPDTAFVASMPGVLYRRVAPANFANQFQDPYAASAFDIAFPTPTHGFAILNYFRQGVIRVLESTDGGVTFDSIGALSQTTLNSRLYFRAVASGGVFGIIGAGPFTSATFSKYLPASGTFVTQTFGNTGSVSDIDFATDTSRGAAVTLGSSIAGFAVRGNVYTTSNGGLSWSQLAGTTASSAVVRYYGVGVRNNGDIWVTGGDGYVAKISGAFGATPTITPVTLAPLVSPDTTNPLAFIYTDVQFAPDNDQVGWIVGAIQTGSDVSGSPTYQGLIFETLDGGATWTRQGVQGVGNYGAGFPKLNRIAVASSSSAIIAGDGGTVLFFAPPGTTP